MMARAARAAGLVDVRRGTVAGQEIACREDLPGDAAMQVHGGTDDDPVSQDLAATSSEMALGVGHALDARSAVDGEQQAVERCLLVSTGEQVDELVLPCGIERIGHRAAGKGSRIGQRHPIDTFDLLDGAEALDALGRDAGHIARDPGVAVEELLPALDEECLLVRTVRGELRAFDMETAHGDAVGL